MTSFMNLDWARAVSLDMLASRGVMRAAARACPVVALSLGFVMVWPAAARAETITYYYTNQQGTPLASADASGNVISVMDYRPYGAQALGTASAGPGYTGHVNDPDSGLVYMQARYFDPAIGRFGSPDAIAVKPADLTGFSRFSYANDNPVSHIDPDGRDCTTNDGMTRCITAVYDVSFPAQVGFRDFTSASANYHFYSVPVINFSTSVSFASAQAVWFPTPGFPKAATPQGTPNDATPFLGGLSPIRISPVMSFTVTNMKDGRPAVVNVTQEGHRLASGIVVREATPLPGIPDGSVTQTWGEGTAPLQAPGSTSGEIINSVWEFEGPPVADKAGCQMSSIGRCN